jgi:hypothetical protein
MVVLVLPLAGLLGELSRRPEQPAPVELIFVRSMAALDLSIGLRIASPVYDPEIPQMTVFVSTEYSLDATSGRLPHSVIPLQSFGAPRSNSVSFWKCCC